MAHFYTHGPGSLRWTQIALDSYYSVIKLWCAEIKQKWKNTNLTIKH